MYIVDVIALVWFVIAITTMIVGSHNSTETVITGFFILVSLILMSVAFHSGAAWQKIDIKQKYILIDKQKPF